MRDDSIPMSRWSRSPSTWRNTAPGPRNRTRSEEHTSELQSQSNLVCRLLLEKKRETVQQEAALGLDVRMRSTAGNFVLGVALDALATKHRFSGAKVADHGKILSRIISFAIAN